MRKKFFIGSGNIRTPVISHQCPEYLINQEEHMHNLISRETNNILQCYDPLLIKHSIRVMVVGNKFSI